MPSQHITHAEEAVSARPALATEAERLRIHPVAIVLTITRTYRTSEQPVETADIVLPVKRYALVYEIGLLVVFTSLGPPGRDTTVE